MVYSHYCWLEQFSVIDTVEVYAEWPNGFCWLQLSSSEKGRPHEKSAIGSLMTF